MSDDIESQSTSEAVKPYGFDVEVVTDAIILDGSTGTRGIVRLAMASSISFLRICHLAISVFCFYWSIISNCK